MPQVTLSDTIGEISVEYNYSSDPSYSLLFSHGSGAGIQNEFMVSLAEEISLLHGNVVRFNFPYMEAGKKFPGSPAPNIETFVQMEEFVLTQNDLPVFLSGKSYGGRMSSHHVSANTSKASGLVYFGFPLHAPGKDSKKRAEHLYQLSIPQLFIQGTKDALANYKMIQEVVSDCKNASMITIEHADHSFKAAKKLSGKSRTEIIQYIAMETDKWMLKLLGI